MAKSFKDLNVGRILGIDLGTTNSVITLYDGNTEQHIPIKGREGEPIIPSLFYIREGKVRVGGKAKEYVRDFPDNVIASVKSHMDDPSYKYIMPNAVDLGGTYGDMELYPIDVTSYILRYIKTIAEEYIQKEYDLTEEESRIEDVVITVPAYFREIERKSTERAAKKVGLNVIEIINEPTAACLAYGYGAHADDEEKTILVFDLGGGTYDITLLKLDPIMYEVIKTDGIKIGGDDFDYALLEYVKTKGSIGVATDKQAKFLIEELKKELSTNDKATIDFLDYAGDSIEITKRQFENQIKDTVFSLIDKVDTIRTGYDIDEVVLVGGSTRIPLIREELIRLLDLPKDYFDKYVIDPDLAVSIGACERGRIILGDTDIVLIDRTPFDLGIELDDGSLHPIIKRGSIVPAHAQQPLESVEGRNTLTFKIYQGNEFVADRNQYLGEIEEKLDGGSVSPVTFKVSFTMNSSGILKVEIMNLLTGGKKEAEITGVLE